MSTWPNSAPPFAVHFIPFALHPRCTIPKREAQICRKCALSGGDCQPLSTDPESVQLICGEAREAGDDGADMQENLESHICAARTKGSIDELLRLTAIKNGMALQVVYSGPVYWTENLTETELNRTGRDRTFGYGLRGLGHGSVTS